MCPGWGEGPQWLRLCTCRPASVWLSAEDTCVHVHARPGPAPAARAASFPLAQLQTREGGAGRAGLDLAPQRGGQAKVGGWGQASEPAGGRAEGAFRLESQCQTLAPLLRGSFFNKQKAWLQAHQPGLRPGLRAPTLRVASPALARRAGRSTTSSATHTAPAGRHPPGSPADSPGPRVLSGCSDGADPHNLSAYGPGEERRQEGGGGAALACGLGALRLPGARHMLGAGAPVLVGLASRRMKDYTELCRACGKGQERMGSGPGTVNPTLRMVDARRSLQTREPSAPPEGRLRSRQALCWPEDGRAGGSWLSGLGLRGEGVAEGPQGLPPTQLQCYPGSLGKWGPQLERGWGGVVLAGPGSRSELSELSVHGWEGLGRAEAKKCEEFEAFHAGGLAPGWNLLVQGHSDSGEDQFEINFLSETGDIVFHIKPRFSSATMVANTFQGGRWGQEEVSSVFPLVLGEPFEMEVSSDAEHFHVHAQEHKVLQFAHRHRPLAAITRVQVLSDHRLAQVELARKGLSWGRLQPHRDPAVLRLDPGCGFRTLETARHPHFSPRPPSSPEPRSCAVRTALPDSQPFRARSPGTSSSPRDKARRPKDRLGPGGPGATSSGLQDPGEAQQGPSVRSDLLREQVMELNVRACKGPARQAVLLTRGCPLAGVTGALQTQPRADPGTRHLAWRTPPQRSQVALVPPPAAPTLVTRARTGCLTHSSGEAEETQPHISWDPPQDGPEQGVTLLADRKQESEPHENSARGQSLTTPGEGRAAPGGHVLALKEAPPGVVGATGSPGVAPDAPHSLGEWTASSPILVPEERICMRSCCVLHHNQHSHQLLHLPALRQVP
uniref:Uncharacterized protein n=1 Tax=Rangifer tarandus platyrhynchus TaxID=3082113 RepID=A0ACB0F736_RANTA|nr:unnamed protein product [Rangifer tarandus platyrhynchus]